MKKGLSSVIALGFVLLSGAANAVLIDFDDANNGDDSYSAGGFTFTPTNFTSGNCAPAASGNGSCFLEDSAGATVMTRTAGGTFTLESFWFQLLGNGNPTTLRIQDNSGSFSDFIVGAVAPAGATVTQFIGGAAVPGNLALNTEYVAGLTTFTNVTSVSFDQVGSGSSGNFRVDCIVATYAGAPTTEAADSCGVSASVPEPGALSLLGAGLLSLGFWRRRRAA